LEWLSKVPTQHGKTPLCCASLNNFDQSHPAVKQQLLMDHWTGEVVYFKDSESQRWVSTNPGDGWALKAETKHNKWGIVFSPSAKAPGSLTLDVKLNAKLYYLIRHSNERHLTVALLFLRSYEHMGKFQVNCSCDGREKHSQITVLDGAWDTHSSAADTKPICIWEPLASARAVAGGCTVRVTPLQPFGKIKVIGVTILKGAYNAIE
jgi:hypothetical protein